MSPRLALATALIASLAPPAAGQAQKESTPTPGPSSLSETYQSWTVRCATPKARKGQRAPARVCEMAQDLTRKRDGQRLLSIGLQPTKKGASLTIVAPFGLLLSAGITVTVEGGSPIHGDFRTCLPRGCVSVISLSRKSLDQFKSGKTAIITMRTTGETDFKIKISLAGFSAAWKSLNEK